MMISRRTRRVLTRSPALAVLPLAWPFIAASFSSSKLLPSLSSMEIPFLSTYGTCGDNAAQGGMLEYSTSARLASHISQTLICNQPFICNEPPSHSSQTLTIWSDLDQHHPNPNRWMRVQKCGVCMSSRRYKPQ